MDKGAVLQSKLEDGSKNHTSLVSEHGDIRLGENSVVQGQTAYIRTGDESGVGGGSIELGDNSQVSARDNVSMNVTGDVVLDGQFLSTSLHETEIRSSEGNVVLKDESELISYGDVYLDAAGSIDIGSDSFIFAGNDPAHTATGSSGISSATPALTPLMLDEATGKLVVWDGQKAGSAVGILVLPLEGTETALTYYKSGTFATEAIRWPESVDEHKKANAFAGSALSHAALP